MNGLFFFSNKDFTIEDVLDEYDSDKDGFISLSEFIGDVRGDGKTTRINSRSNSSAVLCSHSKY